jgi:hypothetical protein
MSARVYDGVGMFNHAAVKVNASVLAQVLCMIK